MGLIRARYAYPIRSRIGISWICSTWLQNAKSRMAKRFLTRWKPLGPGCHWRLLAQNWRIA
jgi:hypothetical protein